MIYTVIGHYTDTGLKYLAHWETETVEDALLFVSDSEDESITVSAVIVGKHVDAMEGDYVEDTDNFEANYGEHK